MLPVEPSGFRTDWAQSAKQVTDPSAAYDTTPLRQQVERARTTTPQTGNPTKAAEAIIADVDRGGTNLHLPLGTGSFQTTMAKLAALSAEYIFSKRSPAAQTTTRRMRELEVGDDLAVHVPAGLKFDGGADLLDRERLL